jgi:LacI family transcriptional regulator
MRTRKNLTLKHIAQRIGVSTTAVSLALRDPSTKRVSAEKRNQILAIARELNYQPNHIARGSVKKESLTIGVVFSTLAIPFYGEIARDIIIRAHEIGYSVIVASLEQLGHSSESTTRKIDEERECIENLVSRGVDGLIICSALKKDPVIFELQERGFPFILALRDVEGGPNDPTLDYIGITIGEVDIWPLNIS